MFFQPILFNIRIPTNTPRTDLLLVCWIGIICLVSSSSNAAPVFPRWPFLASDSVHVVSPATSDASKAASALQMPALNHPSPHAIADGKLGSIKPLPKKSPTPSNSISLENTARKVPSPESQENSLLFKKKPPQNNPAEQQVNTRTSFPSQKAAVKNPKPFKPKPPDKPLKFRFGSSFKDDLKRKKSSPSLWKRLKEMMENKLTVIHLFKALLRRLKLYTPRQSASAQSFSEAAHNAQKAANFKKLSSTFKSTGVMNEAKSAKADAIKPSTIETDLHHQTERNNLPPSSWWELGPLSPVYSVVNGIKPLLHRAPTPSPVVESTGHLSLGEVNKILPSKATPSKFSGSPADGPSVVYLGGGSQPAKNHILPSEIQPHPEGARPKNSNLPSNVKAEVARAELEKLINGILTPIVSKYLTREKTSRIVDSSLRRRGSFMKWAVSWLPQNYPHNFIQETIAPPIVRAFSSWATRKIMMLSTQNMFEVMEHHALDLLAAIQKANSPPPTPP